MNYVGITGMGSVTSLGVGVSALQAGLWSGDRAFGDSPRVRFPDGLHYPLAAAPVAHAPGEDRALGLAMLAAQEAVEDAGWSLETLVDPATLLVVATTKSGVGVGAEVLEGTLSAERAGAALPFALASALARELGIKGPRQTISIACASGLIAVGRARRALLGGEAKRALVVGADALSNFIARGFHNLQALDRAGARPFDQDRAGLTVGEGGAAVALELNRGSIVLTGYGAGNDAHHITGPARDGRGLIKALAQAQEDAGIDANAICVGVVHGTATRFNDAMEGVAYAQVFGERALPVLSVKGNIGHLMGAAGLVNLIVAARALAVGKAPPTAGLQRLDPDIALDVVQDEPRPLADGCAVASASGFGGVNASVILKRCTAAQADGRRRPAVGPSMASRHRCRLAAVIDLSTDRAHLIERVGARAARRLDPPSLLGVAAVQAAREASRLDVATFRAVKHALVLGTALGSLESDYEYYRRELHPDVHQPSPRLFAYTLPNIALGEAALREELMGEQLVISAGRASHLTALAEGIRLIQHGAAEIVIALGIDAVGPAAHRLFAWGPPPQPRAVAWLLTANQDPANSRPELLEPTIFSSPSSSWQRPAVVNTTPAVLESRRPAGTPTEPLGAAGVDELLSLHRARRSGSVRVVCPTGHGVQVGYKSE